MVEIKKKQKNNQTETSTIKDQAFAFLYFSNGFEIIKYLPIFDNSVLDTSLKIENFTNFQSIDNNNK